MKKITLYEVATADGGGMGRYGLKRFFLDRTDAVIESDNHGGFGMVTEHVAYKDGDDILLGEDNGAYTRTERIVYLARPLSEEKAIIASILSNLSAEEVWLLKNRF